MYSPAFTVLKYPCQAYFERTTRSHNDCELFLYNIYFDSENSIHKKLNT